MSEQAEPEPATSSACCADALRPIEPPENARRPARGDAERVTEAGRGRALELGRGALRGRARARCATRATGSARSAAVAAGGVAAGGAGARRGAAGGGASGIRATVGASARTSQVSSDAAPGAPTQVRSAAERQARLRACRARRERVGLAAVGVAAPAPRPIRPRIRCRKLSSLLTGTSASSESSVADRRSPRSPARCRRGPTAEAVGPRAGGASRRPRARAGPCAMWTRLCQPLTAEDPEDVVGSP